TVQLLLSLSTNVFPSSLILPGRLTALVDIFSAFEVSCFISLGLVVSWASASKDVTSASRKEIDTSFFIHDSFRTEYSRETLLVWSFITFRSGHEWREVCGFELQQVCSLATLPVKHHGAVLRCSAGEFFLALSSYAVCGAAFGFFRRARISSFSCWRVRQRVWGCIRSTGAAL